MENEDDSEDENPIFRWVRENDPNTDTLFVYGVNDYIQNMTDDQWEQLGRDISNNTCLAKLSFFDDALNDHKISFFFRGLTRSSSITNISLERDRLSSVGAVNRLTVNAIQSMVPFLQNADNLTCLNLNFNNIQSEGFNSLLRALCDSPIENLHCCGCGIELIEIDSDNVPKHLGRLVLSDNRINADGCRGLANLLQGEDATLPELYLDGNKIDDEGVDILVAALQSNISLETLDLSLNYMTEEGKIMLLKLVSDVSSINATFQSNHKLRHLSMDSLDADEEIETQIDMALAINEANRLFRPELAGRIKVIRAQLHSETRTRFANLQGVDHSLYSEINPLHLPEVLAMVGQCHGQSELYMALNSSVAGVISTVNRKQCLLQQRMYYSNKIDAIDAEIAAIGDGEGLADLRRDSPSGIKRRRV